MKHKKVSANRLFYTTIIVLLLICAVEIAQASSSPVGVISSVQGNVEVLRAGGFIPLEKGDVVSPGDTFRSGKGGQAVISLSGGGVVRIDPGTRSSIFIGSSQAKNGKTAEQVVIKVGRGKVQVAQRPGTTPVVVHAGDLSAFVGGDVKNISTAIISNISGISSAAAGQGVVMVNTESGQSQSVLPGRGVSVQNRVDFGPPPVAIPRAAFLSEIRLLGSMDKETNKVATDIPVTTRQPGLLPTTQTATTTVEYVYVPGAATTTTTSSSSSSSLSSSSSSSTTHSVSPPPPPPPSSPPPPRTVNWWQSEVTIPSSWVEKTSYTEANTTDNNWYLSRFIPTQCQGSACYSGDIIYNIGTTSRFSQSGGILSINGMFKLGKVNVNSNTINGERYWQSLNDYYVLPALSSLGFTPTLGNNYFSNAPYSWQSLDSNGTGWKGITVGLTNPDGTYKIDARFAYVLPDGEIGFIKLDSPWTGTFDQAALTFSADVPYTLALVGKVNYSSYAQYLDHNGGFTFSAQSLSQGTDNSNLYVWHGYGSNPVGTYLGVTAGTITGNAPSGNLPINGYLSSEYNRLSLSTNWSNGSITGSITGKYISQYAYGTISGNAWGIYNGTEGNFALVSSGDLSAVPVNTFGSAMYPWDAVNYYQIATGFGTLDDPLTVGHNIVGYGYMENMPASGKYVNLNDSSGLNNYSQFPASGFLVNAVGADLIDADAKTYSSHQLGIYFKSSNNEGGIFKYSMSGNLDSTGAFDISGTVTDVIPVETLPSTIGIYGNSLSAGNSETVQASGIGVNGNMQFSDYSLALQDISNNNYASWGAFKANATQISYSGMSPSFDISFTDPSQWGGATWMQPSSQWFFINDNGNGTVSGRLFGGQLATIDNSTFTPAIVAADVYGAYDPNTATLNMAAIGASITVDKFLSMVDDPTKQATLQAMGIPITERYNATVNTATLYDGSNTQVGSVTTVGLNNKFRAFGDTSSSTNGVWTLQVNGNHAMNGGQSPASVQKINVASSNIDGTTYSMNITPHNSSQFMSGGSIAGMVSGASNKGMTVNGVAAGSYTGGDGAGATGTISITGGGAWKK